jgi:ketosteroid isomerase-like protein
MADRMKAGDFEAAFGVLADDVEWHEIGRAEPTRGKPGGSRCSHATHAQSVANQFQRGGVR